MSGFQDVFGSEDQGYVLPAFGVMPSYPGGGLRCTGTKADLVPCRKRFLAGVAAC